ncbi:MULTISPECIES: YebC/PmpR family DNA-binding transcriptional regulator [Halobacillus]|uniref:YebC/PmpR family DNA-binding transcriptional regulator n=1 Tax=Halobacillus TaxID=45667 RepID=UPI0013713A8A|nr:MULTISPECIES: YebC/PmpR family DNA-binding transcriptional regulator [Halobacillus]MYL29046.1 YebC/PmpR family DNA-binding transcriptional regulator [Halobacillus halophilus]MYL37297.1 YebC/PmpR family DNA-binding transcriptional regulator [Halobacillus litoralis]
MAGHSKWSNIKHRKGAQDAKRGKLFMKLAREIFMAAKQGGGDEETNPALRIAADKARSNNMPKDNIERAVKKATGDLEGVNYEEFTYEGYGPGGVAVMVKVLTDNKNRTAGEVRHAFSKNDGNLGENGCVAFMFNRSGYLVIDRSTTEADEEAMMLEVIEAGAEEMETTEESFEIYTEPETFSDVKASLEESGYTFSTSEVTMIPETYTELEEEGVEKMLKLIDMLEDNDDVQEVYHNLDADEAVLEKLS